MNRVLEEGKGFSGHVSSPQSDSGPWQPVRNTMSETVKDKQTITFILKVLFRTEEYLDSRESPFPRTYFGGNDLSDDCLVGTFYPRTRDRRGGNPVVS